MSMADINSTTSIVTLNVNGLNATNKKEIVIVDQNQEPTICCLWETHFKYKDTHRWKVNG